MEAVRWLLLSGVRTDLRDDDGRCALIHALLRGHVGVARTIDECARSPKRTQGALPTCTGRTRIQPPWPPSRRLARPLRAVLVSRPPPPTRRAQGDAWRRHSGMPSG